MRFSIDTSVALYAVGGQSPYREACRRLVALLTEGIVAGEASLSIVQEYAEFRGRRTRDRAKALDEAACWMELLTVHPVAQADMQRALHLSSSVADLDCLGALHAATCLNRSIPLLVSTNGHLDAVPGLQRVDPRDAEAALLPLREG